MARTPRTTKAKAAAPAAAAPQPAGDTAPASSEPAPAATPTGDLIPVTVASVSPAGRRRAGQAFGREPVELTVSEETLALLEGDPQLIVTRSAA